MNIERMGAGSQRARVQHTREDHGDALYVVRGIFLLRQRIEGGFWTLRPGECDLHALYKSHPTICR